MNYLYLQQSIIGRSSRITLHAPPTIMNESPLPNPPPPLPPPNDAEARLMYVAVVCALPHCMCPLLALFAVGPSSLPVGFVTAKLIQSEQVAHNFAYLFCT